MSTRHAYDTCLIGSSPLLILSAIHEEKQNRSVCVIEKAERLGGAWAIDKLSDAGDFRHVETSCHLVEWYKSGYEILEELGGVPFVPMQPQPVKVHTDGKVTPYTTAASIYKTIAFNVGAFVVNNWRILVRSVTRDQIGLEKARARLCEVSDTLGFDLHTRFSAYLNYKNVREPLGGYANWLQDLINQLKKSSAKLLFDKAISASKTTDEGWRVELSSGNFVEAKKLILGESSSLQNIDGKIISEPPLTTYNNVIVSINATDTMIRNKYIHCPNHPTINRISYIFDYKTEANVVRSLWLIQLHQQDLSSEEIMRNMKEISEKYPFIRGDLMTCSVEARYERSHVRSPSDVKKLSIEGKNLTVLKTVGNLSKTVLQNQNFFEDYLNKIRGC